MTMRGLLTKGINSITSGLKNSARDAENRLLRAVSGAGEAVGIKTEKRANFSKFQEAWMMYK